MVCVVFRVIVGVCRFWSLVYVSGCREWLEVMKSCIKVILVFLVGVCVGELVHRVSGKIVWSSLWVCFGLLIVFLGAWLVSVILGLLYK